jgi:phage tail-like protein
MPTGDRKDPYRGYNFKLEIDGIQRNGFRECSGLDAKSAPIDYREGDEKVYTNRKLPGQTTYSNISLKMGKTDDKDLWEWRKKVIDGKTERKNGSIILMNESGEEKVRWNFVNGWPTSWVGPSMNATANEVAIETIEIVHEGITLA